MSYGQDLGQTLVIYNGVRNILTVFGEMALLSLIMLMEAQGRDSKPKGKEHRGDCRYRVMIRTLYLEKLP